MKYILTTLLLWLTTPAISQSTLPTFLQGTWKMEHKETYEHWDLLNDRTMKGISYNLKNGEMQISEYLDISNAANKVIYTATVVHQNQGKGIAFTLTKSDSTFSFENTGHDFPKKITYKPLSEIEIWVEVSDNQQKAYAYTLKKQHEKTDAIDTTIANPKYDKALAQKLGADDYGMKSYMLVLLKTGTNQTKDQTLISESFRGHMDNINRLVKDGKLIVAGPLGKNDKTYRGIFILNVTNAADAEKLLLTDPAINQGLLAFELYNWYGSAALAEYLEASDKVWKINP